MELANCTFQPKTARSKREPTLTRATVDKLSKPGKSIDLNSLEEGEVGESTQAEGERQLLRGFREAKVKIHLLGEKDLRAYATKRKYQGLFDVGVLSVYSADKISAELTSLFRDRARVFCESADFLICMKPEQRVAFKAKVTEKATEAAWDMITPAPFKHHMLFEVPNPAANSLPPEQDSDSSFEL